LNLSQKLYKTPFTFLEYDKINSLSYNWLNNVKKHSKEYKKYVFDRFRHLNFKEKTKTNEMFQKEILNSNFYLFQNNF
jgi:hypothetical protein